MESNPNCKKEITSFYCCESYKTERKIGIKTKNKENKEENDKKREGFVGCDETRNGTVVIMFPPLRRFLAYAVSFSRDIRNKSMGDQTVYGMGLTAKEIASMFDPQQFCGTGFVPTSHCSIDI